MRSQLKYLKEYLGIFESLEDDLILVEDARMPGTCEWLESRISYVEWSTFEPGTPHILWVNGKPAAGKSVLAGYIINKLRRKGNCSFYFFKYGDKSKSRLDNCLRSLAFQMACTDYHVQQTLLEMYKNDIKLDSNDERITWRKLFLSGIFQANLKRHYWVIDALDESENITSFFDTVLAKLDWSMPLRILVTSRESPEIGKHLSGLGSHVFQSERITTADTIIDIKLLVEAKARSLLVKDDNDRAVLMDKILKKSQGSFLWTVLVLSELSNSYTELEINKVLEDVPPDMELLYKRSLDLMSQATRGKQLGSAILIWATCATKPLKMNELVYALKLDIGDSFPKLQEIIGAVCGQLVTVDKFGSVQLIHETVREFLLRGDLASEFAISRVLAHTRIARVCLKYLTGEEMNPPRTNRRNTDVSVGERRAGFSTYACAAFSYHLSKADPLANDVFLLLNKFLRSNVLSWIEVIARSKDLALLIRTAKYLKVYLNSCTVQRSPLGGEMQIIRGWATDLVRIAAKFADALILSPSSIYSLILPFCPKESTIYKTARPGRKLSVVGLSNTEWDDRLTSIEFRQVQATAICYGDEFFAVGLSTGRVAVYHATSYQEYRSLDHGEAVKFLQIGRKPELIASCGLKAIHLWEIRSGQLVHTFQTPQRSVGLTFDRDLLIVACAKNYLTSWDLSNDGARRPDKPWNDSEDTNVKTRRAPSAISISVGHQMLAVAYAGKPITLWDLRENTYYGNCGKKLLDGETSTHLVTALIFNPNAAIERLVASYLDGDLVLLDPFSDQVLVSFRADCHTLATSPDGRLVAGSAGSGTIQIYEFDTLTMLYRVQSSSYYIKQLAFSKDSLHFADIRGSQCNIWEPMALLRNSISDDNSENTSTSVAEEVAMDSKARISAMVADPTEGVVFCSKDDGSVCIYDLKSGAHLRTLYSHKSAVSLLTWWPQRNVIMSVDISNRISAWSLKKSPRGELLVEEVLFQSRLDCGKAITQVLPSAAVGKLILSTRETDHLWTISGHEDDVRMHKERPGIRKWFQHQESSHHIISIDGTTARIYTWSDWSEVASVKLNIDITGRQIKNVIPYVSQNGQRILIELSELDGSANTCGLYLLNGLQYATDTIRSNEVDYEKADVSLDVGTASKSRERIQEGEILTHLIDKRLSSLEHNVAHIVGLDVSNRIVFLDNYSWVCSVDLEESEDSPGLYLRHFFVPYDWFSGTRNVVALVTRRDVLIARNSDVAIVRPGLEYTQDSGVRLGGTKKSCSSIF
jgi:WD40 repeat protein